MQAATRTDSRPALAGSESVPPRRNCQKAIAGVSALPEEPPSPGPPGSLGLRSRYGQGGPRADGNRVGNVPT